MKTKKQLGIWMDHATANLVELNNNIVSKTIEAKSFIQEDEGINWKDETLIRNKEQTDLSNFFDKLVDVMKDYDEVLLFGPTNAKNELVNILKVDHHFDEIKIEVKPADKMTENQQLAFVKEHFKIAD